MKPLSLRASGLGRFPDLELDFPAGCAAIVGPNGAGKSTLLNAVELALFAEGSRDLAPLLGPWSDRLELELEFEHDRETYRVRQAYRVGSSGRGTATVDFEKADTFDGVRLPSDTTPHVWAPLTRENADATRALIVQTIGLSRRTFRASSFLAQGDAAAFPEASPADRKAILGEILDPRGLWPRLAATARDRAKAVDAEISADRALAADREQRAVELPQLRSASETLERQEQTARAELTEAERVLQLAQDAMAANTVAAERVKSATLKAATARAAVTAAEEALKQARLAANQLAPAREHLAQLQARAQRVPELEQKLDEQRKQLAEQTARGAAIEAGRATMGRLLRVAEQAKTDLDAAAATSRSLAAESERLAGAADGHERCATCQQLLGTGARLAAIEATSRAFENAGTVLTEKEAAYAAAAREAEEARSAFHALPLPEIKPVEDIDASLREAREAAAGIPQAAHNVTELERRADEIPDHEVGVMEATADLRVAETELAEASKGVVDQAVLANAVVDAKRAASGKRLTLDGDTAALTIARERVKTAEQAEQDLTEIRARNEQAQTRLDLLRLAERAYGRDGIPVLLVENVIPQIEAEANRILEQMPTSDGVVFNLELRTQRAQKTDTTKLTETLDIIVSDPDGPRSYETYSGGERARLNIALRIALARLLAGRRGAESRLLAIDELEYLDALGQGQLVDVVRGVESDFDRILIVSHADVLRDAFDSVIEIEKRDGVSAIAGAREPDVETEAVAA